MSWISQFKNFHYRPLYFPRRLSTSSIHQKFRNETKPHFSLILLIISTLHRINLWDCDVTHDLSSFSKLYTCASQQRDTSYYRTLVVRWCHFVCLVCLFIFFLKPNGFFMYTLYVYFIVDINAWSGRCNFLIISCHRWIWHDKKIFEHDG